MAATGVPVKPSLRRARRRGRTASRISNDGNPGCSPAATLVECVLNDEPDLRPVSPLQHKCRFGDAPAGAARPSLSRPVVASRPSARWALAAKGLNSRRCWRVRAAISRDGTTQHRDRPLGGIIRVTPMRSVSTDAAESSLAASEPTPGPVRPFLKWAGGKRQLLPQLRRFIPVEFGSYHEPFVGSGALFFDLRQRGQLAHRSARLVDTNADLIGCYRALVQDVDGVIRSLTQLARRHAKSPADHYYRVRDELFNPARRARTAADGGGSYPPELAAMFIYLNRTGFNGLYRLNSQGLFNVPAGRYSNPQICDGANLKAAARALGSPAVELVHGVYESVLGAARKGDLVYLDPPYAPLSTTSQFTSYTAGGFSDDDQRLLQQVVIELAERGCYVVLSNSTAAIIANLYETNRSAKQVGLRTYRVPAKRAINSNPTKRGDVMEFIITNVPPTD